MGGVTLARHVEQPEPIDGCEHRGARADDHVVAPSDDLQPRPIPGALVAAEEQPRSIAEHIEQRRRGRRHRHRLRDQHDRPTAPREARGHCLDRGVLLVLGSGSEDERALALLDRPEQVCPTSVPGEHRLRRRHRGCATGRLVGSRLPCGLLGGHARRDRSTDHRRQRGDVALTHPAEERESPIVE
jgi:hypothetical protein